jgi:UDP-galactopyranose mutase
MAEELDKKVLVLEKRSHIAGNAYDERMEDGILVQKYGPHIFHTNNESVYKFITNYGQWIPFTLKCEVLMNGITTPSPFNLQTIDSFYSPEDARNLKNAIKQEYPNNNSITIVELLKSSNKLLQQYARMLFDNDYSPYTAKQWGIEPSEIDISVLNRVPVRFDYTNRYFDDKYECLPEISYTDFFEKLLSHRNIDIQLNTNALDCMRVDTQDYCVYYNNQALDIPVVYTGALDALLEYKYGVLPYRSLRFKYETKDIPSFQNVPVVAHPQAKDFTRITEYTKLPVQTDHIKTIIAYEYPVKVDVNNANSIEPYYPIINESNLSMYDQYAKLIDDIPNLFLCGRLADYKYYNMDNAVVRALEVYEKIKQNM